MHFQVVLNKHHLVGGVFGFQRKMSVGWVMRRLRSRRMLMKYRTECANMEDVGGNECLGIDRIERGL